MKPTIQQATDAIVKLDHLNIGVIILALIAFAGILLVFLFNLKKVLTNVSGSLKDPITGRWSGKLLSAFAINGMIVLCHIVWLKYAFMKDDFSLLIPIMGLDYAYLTAVYGLRTLEKMQDNKLNKAVENDKGTV